MNVETKRIICKTAEFAGELILGAGMATVSKKVIDPKIDSKCEQLVVDGALMIGGWMIGRQFGKTWFKFCDIAFGTDFNEEELLDKYI